MIESIVLLISVIVGGGVLVYTMNDFLLSFVRKIVVPAIKPITGEAADIILTILDLIESRVSYTAQTIRKVVYSFQEKVLGIITNYQKIAYNEAEIKTETYIIEENNQLRKISTNQRVEMDNLPSEVQEKLAQRNRVEMRHEEDLLNELKKKIKL
jgi:hypothetical protein